MPHVAWLQDRLSDGSLLASGPVNGTSIKSALLIMSAPSLASLNDVIASDPFATEGLIENMIIREWDPIFGAFNEQSSMPSAIQAD
tara:strand:+ start:28173 stop:28430 length:258 start_codon:yes stop_codon:yes gene_type:complete